MCTPVSVYMLYHVPAVQFYCFHSSFLHRMFAVLSAILHIGNIEFETVFDGFFFFFYKINCALN